MNKQQAFILQNFFIVTYLNHIQIMASLRHFMDLRFNFGGQEQLLLPCQLMNEAEFPPRKILPACLRLLLCFIVKFEIKGHPLNLFGLFDYNLSILKMFFIFRLVNEPDYLNNFYSKFLKLSSQFLYLTMEVLSLDLYDEFTAHLKNFKFNLVLQHLQLIQQEQPP